MEREIIAAITAVFWIATVYVSASRPTVKLGLYVAGGAAAFGAYAQILKGVTDPVAIVAGAFVHGGWCLALVALVWIVKKLQACRHQAG